MSTAAPRPPRADHRSLAVPTAFPRAASRFEKFQHLVSIGGPIGFIPWVPATWASLATAAVCWRIAPSHLAIAAASLLLFFLGAWTATTSERLLHSEDPRNVVIDEILGQTLAFLFVAPVSLKIAAAGFVLFRVFDILKPPPARQAERLPGGWGIMADDAIAALFAAVALYLLRPWLG